MLGGASHGELVQIYFSKQHRPCPTQAANRLRIVRRAVALQHTRGAGGAQILRAKIILNGVGNAVKRSEALSPAASLVRGTGGKKRTLGVHRQVCADPSVNRFDLPQKGTGKLLGGIFAARKSGSVLANGAKKKLLHTHSSTVRGTRKKPSLTSGAPRRSRSRERLSSGRSSRSSESAASRMPR